MKNCRLFDNINCENGILDAICLGKEEELLKIKIKVKESLLKENIDIDRRYDNFIKVMEKANINEETKNEIINRFNIYFEEKNYSDSIISEEYYKEGIKDGIELVILAICKER